MTAGINLTTGVVTWTFMSIDPTTGDLPPDIFTGFLPPDKTAPQGEGSVTYTVRPKPSNTSGTRIDAQASIVFDTNAPVPTNAVTNTIASPNQIYLDRAYLDLLNRPIDDGGLSYWGGLLDHGTPRFQVAAALDHSAEFYASIIRPAYQQFLGRGPDPDGLAYWINQMQHGLTDEQLEAGFIGSPEYYQHAGGTDKAWVDAMYLNLLGRGPDLGGEAYWLKQLANHVTRSSVAYGFAASGEREGQLVHADYRKYLGRTAAAVEVAYWVDQFQHGLTNEDVVTGFVASDEYFRTHGNP